MKKKILVIILMVCLFVTGCFNKKDNLSEFKKKTEKLKNYYLTGILEIMNNEDVYKYDVKVSYKDKDKYKVDLINKTNNHEQIILRNENGVYVITPSLNKSFKFQSEWPYNNSQSYLLQSIVSDINSDKNKKIINKGKQTIITTKTNYKNNPKLVTQRIYLEDSLPKKVEVYDKDDNISIKMKFNSVDLKPKFDKDYFNISKETSKTVETSKQLKDIVYPMNMPNNTYLASEEKINIDNGERAILTFLGEKPFTLIEETISVDKEFELIDGEPEFLVDTVGALSDKSATWISNGVEYYATSSVMSEVELLDVVKSMSTIPVSK